MHGEGGQRGTVEVIPLEAHHRAAARRAKAADMVTLAVFAVAVIATSTVMKSGWVAEEGRSVGTIAGGVVGAGLLVALLIAALMTRSLRADLAEGTVRRFTGEWSLTAQEVVRDTESGSQITHHVFADVPLPASTTLASSIAWHGGQQLDSGTGYGPMADIGRPGVRGASRLVARRAGVVEYLPRSRIIVRLGEDGGRQYMPRKPG